jgi:hypothetical protein
MPENDDTETVEEILKRKKSTIQQAPLDPSSPSWDDIRRETWKSIKQKARRRKTGYRKFRKLLTDGRFDKK